MKILKLILLVVLVAGVICGIVFIPGLITPTPPAPEFNTDSMYQELVVMVDNTWQNQDPRWDVDTYEYVSAIIAGKSEQLSSGGYESLCQQNALGASNALNKSMMDEFAKCDCDRDTIKRFYNELLELKKTEDYRLADNKDIKDCEETYNLYKSILIFGNQKFGLSPDFKKSTGTFNSFFDYKDAILKQCDDYQDNSYYGRISNITDIHKSFDRVSEKLDSIGEIYPDRVVDAIIVSFKNISEDDRYTDDNFRLLQNAYNNVSIKYSNTKAFSRIKSYVKNFEYEVEERKNPNNRMR